MPILQRLLVPVLDILFAYCSFPAKLITVSLLCRSHPLDSRHSAAVLHYMLEVLPQLHDDSSSPAASLLLHILMSSAAPGPLLQSATALLKNLPLQDTSPAAPSGSQVQLACDLLALFTAEAFQTVSKSRGAAAKAAKASVDAGFEMLLHLLRFGLDGGSSGEQVAERLRLAAYQQLGAELYAVMPVQQQMEAFLVSFSVIVPLPALSPSLTFQLHAEKCTLLSCWCIHPPADSQRCAT